MRPLARLARFARPYLPRYLGGLVLLVCTNGLGLWIPWLLRDAIRALQAGVDLAAIGRLAALMMAVALAQACARTVSRWTILGASRRAAYDVRNRFFAQLQRLGPSYYDTHRTGDIMSRGINDVQLLQSFFGPGVLNMLNTSIVYSAVLVLLLQIDVGLTLVSLLVYPALLFAVNRISKRVYARSLAVQEQLAAISNRAQENISGIQQVKIYVQEEREIAAFRELCDEYRSRNLSMAKLRGGMIALIGMATGLGTLVVLFLGGLYVIRGRMDLGDLVAFNAYLAMLAFPTIALGWIINVFQRGLGAMERLGEVLDHPLDMPAAVDEPPRQDGSAWPAVDGEIELRRLTFAYPGRSGGEPPRPVLREIEVTIERGSRVAIVGAVGSGKSTLAHVLARFYPVPPGTVFVGGVDITEIPVSRMRASIGYVPQEAFLFARTIRENVVLGQPDADQTEVARAVELAQLAADVAAFPDGLETVVGERGFTLSGGQRQRATLARALVGRRPILILDDSLSAVDADTERAILAELDRQAADRTLILISHRPSTLAGMDRILVLEDGRLVEEGSHADLLARQGVYAQLFRRQMLEERLSGG